MKQILIWCFQRSISWKHRGPQTGTPGILPAFSLRRHSAAFGNTCRKTDTGHSAQTGHRWWTIWRENTSVDSFILESPNLFVRFLLTHLPMNKWQTLHFCVENLCLCVRRGYSFLSRQSLLWTSLKRETWEACFASPSWHGEQHLRALPLHTPQTDSSITASFLLIRGTKWAVRSCEQSLGWQERALSQILKWVVS